MWRVICRYFHAQFQCKTPRPVRIIRTHHGNRPNIFRHCQQRQQQQSPPAWCAWTFKVALVFRVGQGLVPRLAPNGIVSSNFFIAKSCFAVFGPPVARGAQDRTRTRRQRVVLLRLVLREVDLGMAGGGRFPKFDSER